MRWQLAFQRAGGAGRAGLQARRHRRTWGSQVRPPPAARLPWVPRATACWKLQLTSQSLGAWPDSAWVSWAVKEASWGGEDGGLFQLWPPGVHTGKLRNKLPEPTQVPCRAGTAGPEHGFLDCGLGSPPGTFRAWFEGLFCPPWWTAESGPLPRGCLETEKLAGFWIPCPASRPCFSTVQTVPVLHDLPHAVGRREEGGSLCRGGRREAGALETTRVEGVHSAWERRGRHLSTANTQGWSPGKETRIHLNVAAVY